MTLGELSDEQRAFEESVRGFLARTIPAERVAQSVRVVSVLPLPACGPHLPQ